MAVPRLSAAGFAALGACRPVAPPPPIGRPAAAWVGEAAGERLGHAIIDDGAAALISAPGARGGAGLVERWRADGGGALERVEVAQGAHAGARLGQSLARAEGGGLWIAGLGPAGETWLLAPPGAAPQTLPGPGQGAALLLREAELLVGVPLHQDRHGSVFSVPLDGAPPSRLDGPAAGALFGASLAAVGDLDGDGIGEVAAGAWGAHTFGGAVALWSGEAPAALADADAVIVGERPWDLLGVSVAGGADLTGDGLPELWIGAPGDDRGGWSAGAVWCLTRPRSGSVRQGRGLLIGPGDGARAGQALAVAPQTRQLAAGAPGAAGGRGGAAVWDAAPRGAAMWSAGAVAAAPPGVDGAGSALGWARGPGGPQLWLGAGATAADAGAALLWPAP